MDTKLQELKNRLYEINDLNMAGGVLGWDQATYMPVGGAPARGRQMATLGRIAHEKLVSPEMGQLLEDLKPLEDSLPYDSDDASLIRVARRTYERQTQVPSDRLAAFFQHSAESYQAWTEARPKNDFKSVEPLLEKTLDFSRELANYFPGYEHVADPLIDFSDFGMKASSVRQVFADLRAQLVPMVKAITEQAPADDSCLRRTYPKKQQIAFGEKIIRAYGYDFNRGRQDETHHPFMTKFSLGDVRITTRFNENDLGDGLFSTLHESGHAMYELGISQDFEGSPLANGTSAGVHESQSRMWENIVGRSRPFWEHYYPQLQATFPGTLDDVSLDTFYRAINKVQRSLIRTDSDEVTYNLHVMIRFELELQLLEGTLAIKDLPEAWHAAYEENLGLRAPDDRDGVLQDVHWYGGLIGGAFQGYTLGNIISGQFYATALKAHPEIPAEVGQGKFDTLHTWLRENIYKHGSKYTAPELIERVTGSSLTIEPYIAYLKAKYGELYQL
ncbi:MAG: carboxypeptidase M32 [Anaerolineales bacterium]|nr:carboxypeptidase M32 [Anaerolineales bacterium]